MSEVQETLVETKKAVEKTEPKQTITFSSVEKEGKFYTLDGKLTTTNRYVKEVSNTKDLSIEEMEAVLKGFFYAENKLANVRQNLSNLFEA